MLIGLTGRAGSGKNTVSKILEKQIERSGGPVVVEIAFAEPLKRFCKDVYDWTEDHVNGHLKEVEDKRYPRPVSYLRWYELPYGLLYKLLKKKEYLPRGPHFLTPRYALQQLGTEWGRNCFSRTWITYAQRKWRGWLQHGYVVAVTDLRFLNEADAISEDSGWIWKIYRSTSSTAATHASETELAAIEADVTIFNTSTIDALPKKIKDAYDYMYSFFNKK